MISLAICSFAESDDELRSPESPELAESLELAGRELSSK